MSSASSDSVQTGRSATDAITKTLWPIVFTFLNADEWHRVARTCRLFDATTFQDRKRVTTLDVVRPVSYDGTIISLVKIFIREAIARTVTYRISNVLRDRNEELMAQWRRLRDYDNIPKADVAIKEELQRKLFYPDYVLLSTPDDRNPFDEGRSGPMTLAVELEGDAVKADPAFPFVHVTMPTILAPLRDYTYYKSTGLPLVQRLAEQALDFYDTQMAWFSGLEEGFLLLISHLAGLTSLPSNGKVAFRSLCLRVTTFATKVREQMDSVHPLVSRDGHTESMGYILKSPTHYKRAVAFFEPFRRFDWVEALLDRLAGLQSQPQQLPLK